MYTSVQEANDYISNHYTEDSAERKRWETLSDNDKNVYLTNAFESIEKLNFNGRKAVPGQETAFPRLPYQYGRLEEVAPKSVKFAEMELALWLSDTKRTAKSKRRKELIEDGVTSFSIGDLSESYSDSSNTKENVSALTCSKCRELLLPYLCGGFEMC